MTTGPAARRDIGFPAHVVATGQATRRIDQHGIQTLVMGMGQPDLGAAFLIERLQMSRVVAQLGRQPTNAARCIFTRSLATICKGRRFSWVHRLCLG
ncbi:hypothetical protein N8D56_12430 [Devosia sp. A8/3-2]|nr:hypothetical protein N8D56_12430 [Devosia sp. A8/3-2]